MAKKVELEAHYNNYRRSCEHVARIEAERDYRAAVRAAEESLPFIHAAITFQRRFQKIDNPVTPTVDCLLRYAPVLFLGKALDAAEKWYADGTRTERNALPDMPDQIAAARQTLVAATKLWSALSSHPGVVVQIDRGLPVAARIIPVWLSAGLIVEINPAGRSEYARACDPRGRVQGKCSECGRAVAAPLASLLDPVACPACGRVSQFIVTSRLN